MKKKLSSRKLWLAIIGFVSALCVTFGVEELKIEQICTLLGALGTLVAYIFAEGYADASHKSDQKTDTPPPKCEGENGSDNSHEFNKMQ